MDRKGAAKAIESLDISKLEYALSKDVASSDAEELVQLILRSNRMIVRKIDPALARRRDAFLAGLPAIFATHFDGSSDTILGHLVSCITEIEAGYRDIQSGVPMSAIATLPTNRQVSAVIARAVKEGQILERQTREALQTEGWQPGLPIIAYDDEGNAYDPDGARTALVRHLGVTLKYLMGHFGRIKIPTPLILPSPERVTEDDIYMAGTALLASAGLRRWRRIDERVRFWGGSIETLDREQLPPGSNLDLLRAYKPGQLPIFDVIANRRLTDVFLKSFQESLEQSPQNVDSSATELAPSAFLSLDEHASYTALTGLLGIKPDEASIKFQDLSLAEWVRGYATMRLIAANTDEADLVFKPHELEGRLQSTGLGIKSARAFLKYSTFGDHSDDLFDSPVIEFADGSHRLFAPAAAHSVIAQIVLSNLGHLGESFSGKGPAFEQTVLRYFKRSGLEPTQIHTFRDGEEYQVDVVLPWGDKLFLFECKTDGLSDNDPVAAYNFEKARDKHITQISRQIDGLRRHPDMLHEVGIPEPEKLDWVPVVLYLFPYTMPIDERGISVADWTGMRRFLGSRHVHLPPVMHEERLHRAVATIRAGEHATPEDLKTYLQGPFQLGLKLACLEPREEMIWLQDRRLARGIELDFVALQFEAAKELFDNIEIGEEIHTGASI